MGRRDLLLEKTKKIDKAQQNEINESETIIDNIINKLDEKPEEEKKEEIVVEIPIPEIKAVTNLPVIEKTISLEEKTDVIENKNDTVIYKTVEIPEVIKPVNEKKSNKKGIKLKAPKKELKTVRTGFIITEKAKANLMRVTKEAGYRSTNDFINDLLENIDEYLA